MLREINEVYQEIVVDGLSIITDGSDKLLDAEFSRAVERRADRSFRGVLNLCSIDDRSVTVRGVLRFLWVGVIGLVLGELDEGYQEFVVYGLSIITDGSEKLLDAEFSCAVERRADRSFRGVLNL